MAQSASETPIDGFDLIPVEIAEILSHGRTNEGMREIIRALDLSLTTANFDHIIKLLPTEGPISLESFFAVGALDPDSVRASRDCGIHYGKPLKKNFDYEDDSDDDDYRDVVEEECRRGRHPLCIRLRDIVNDVLQLLERLWLTPAMRFAFAALGVLPIFYFEVPSCVVGDSPHFATTPLNPEWLATIQDMSFFEAFIYLLTVYKEYVRQLGESPNPFEASPPFVSRFGGDRFDEFVMKIANFKLQMHEIFYEIVDSPLIKRALCTAVVDAATDNAAAQSL